MNYTLKAMQATAELLDKMLTNPGRLTPAQIRNVKRAKALVRTIDKQINTAAKLCRHKLLDHGACRTCGKRIKGGAS